MNPWILALSFLFAEPAFATDPQTVCEGAYPVVCGDSAISRNLPREKELSLSIRSKAIEAIPGATQPTGEDAAKHEEVSSELVVDLNRYLDLVDDAALRAAGVSMSELHTLFTDLKHFYLTLVQTRPEFREKLARMDLFGSKDFVGRGYMFQYYAGCGSSGLAANAMSEGPSVVICPGFLVSLAARRATHEQALDSLALVLGHELGHAVDSWKFPKAYLDLPKKGPNKGRIAREVSSDSWSITAGVRRFEGRSAQDIADAWAFHFAWFCALPAEDEPMHRTRFIWLSRRSDVRAQLGCR